MTLSQERVGVSYEHCPSVCSCVLLIVVCFKKGRDPEGSLMLRLLREQLLLLGGQVGTHGEDGFFGLEFSLE